MIDRIKQTVEAYLNTDQRGNFTPTKYELILNNSVNDCYEDLLDAVNRAINRQNRGLINGGLDNIPDKIRERIQYYLKTATLTYVDPYFTLPADMRYFDIPLYNDEEIQLCKSRKDFTILSKSNPTLEYPIGLKEADKLSVLPTTINSGVTVSYLRNPLFATWTYTSIGDVEAFNPSDGNFVDVDIHPSEFTNLVIRVLQGFGVRLKEEDIQKITQSEKILEFNQENQS